MLKLFLTPTSIVFEDLSDYMFEHLQRKHDIEFKVEEGEYKIVDKPEYLFKLLYKLTCDYDIKLK